MGNERYKYVRWRARTTSGGHYSCVETSDGVRHQAIIDVPKKKGERCTIRITNQETGEESLDSAPTQSLAKRKFTEYLTQYEGIE